MNARSYEELSKAVMGARSHIGARRPDPKRDPEDAEQWDALTEVVEHLSVAQGQGWRPIESAPRDGTFVLLTDSRTNESCHLIARWRHGKWWGQLTQSGRAILWNDATHWQPLPAAPAQPDGVE